MLYSALLFTAFLSVPFTSFKPVTKEEISMSVYIKNGKLYSIIKYNTAQPHPPSYFFGVKMYTQKESTIQSCLMATFNPIH